MALGAPDPWPGVVKQVFSFAFVESPWPLSLSATLLCSRPDVGLWSGEGFHLSVGIRKML